MANNVNPDQTAHIGAVCSEFTRFASILNSSVFAAGDFSRRHFQEHFFLGALRVKHEFREYVSKYSIKVRKNAKIRNRYNQAPHLPDPG